MTDSQPLLPLEAGRFEQQHSPNELAWLHCGLLPQMPGWLPIRNLSFCLLLKLVVGRCLSFRFPRHVLAPHELGSRVADHCCWAE